MLREETNHGLYRVSVYDRSSEPRSDHNSTRPTRVPHQRTRYSEMAATLRAHARRAPASHYGFILRRLQSYEATPNKSELCRQGEALIRRDELVCKKRSQNHHTKPSSPEIPHAKSSRPIRVFPSTRAKHYTTSLQNSHPRFTKTRHLFGILLINLSNPYVARKLHISKAYSR
jgi:hypothetical protein